ncbi:hypothetical protein MHU86_4941 [Fragilaria crotonensis]|nr:hypothetical protein MHU86_4941 [Fragilaria crotonensis]
MSEDILQEQRRGEERENPYDEERRILLQGVAESLTRIIEKFATVNQNLKVMEERNSDIKAVGDLWKAATITLQSSSTDVALFGDTSR